MGSDVEDCEALGVLGAFVSLFECQCLVSEVLQSFIDLRLGVVLADMNLLKAEAFFEDSDCILSFGLSILVDVVFDES